MLGLAGIPSLLMFVGLLAMPESPRWLVYHGKDDKARESLSKVRPASEIDAELNTIKDDYEKQKKLKLGMTIVLYRNKSV